MTVKNVNNINYVSFPETAILPWVDGDFELCGEISAAYLEGRLEQFVKSSNVNDRLKNVIGYLMEVSEYNTIKEQM